MIAILLLLNSLLNKNLFMKYMREDKKILNSLICFFVFYLVSTMVGIFLIVQVVEIPGWATGRFNPVAGTILELGYIFLNVFVFAISLSSGKEIKEELINSWLAGATLASFYSIYLAICSAAGKIPYKLPGMIQEFQYSSTVAGLSLIRQGTFLEGNFMGGFAVLSFVMTVYMYESTKKSGYFLLAALFFFTTLLTFSTISLLSLVIFMILYCLYKIRQLKNMTGIIFILLFLLLIISVVRTSLFREMVFSKIFIDRESNYSMAMSRLDRINQSITGLKIFCEYPATGVGPGNYGLYYEKFIYDKHFASGNFKHISNNVYIKLLSEGGIMAFSTFLLFMVLIFLKYIRHRKNRYADVTAVLLYGMICIMIIFMAYPTFNLTFLWAYFAIVVLSTGQNKGQKGGCV